MRCDPMATDAIQMLDVPSRGAAINWAVDDKQPTTAPTVERTWHMGFAPACHHGPLCQHTLHRPGLSTHHAQLDASARIASMCCAAAAAPA